MPQDILDIFSIFRLIWLPYSHKGYSYKRLCILGLDSKFEWPNWKLQRIPMFSLRKWSLQRWVFAGNIIIFQRQKCQSRVIKNRISRNTLFFYKNNFIRTLGWDFAQSWSKIKNNLRTFEAETLKIWQKSWEIDIWGKIKKNLRTFEAEI